MGVKFCRFFVFFLNDLKFIIQIAGSGYYMCIRPSYYGRYRNPGILESKQFHTEKDSCLSFRYLMYGTSVFKLRVYANYSDDGVNNKTVAILNVTGNQGDIWRIHTKTLPPGSFSIVFEASSSGSSGNSAIDDVVLRTEPCITNTSGKCFIMQDMQYFFGGIHFSVFTLQ